MAEREWRVPFAQVAAKWAATAAAAVLAAASAGDRQFLLLAGAAAIGLAALALRDVLAPVRVAADTGAVTVVAGYAGRRRIPWDEVAAVRVDERRRLLLHTRLLEIETADDLHLFSRFDLGAEVDDVAAALGELRHGSSAGVG
ncbi:PH domain-containing protein [Actinomadura sp. WMMB 499]|uniref:PH domain-containing protein n=1 Tax=Actinomadura sp. WMMB 499 TaxID=1219491 RepID=UPI001248DB1D|nr:PH domain-containing protein [Actinomadura sp. WMMB 499]QFG20455.1 PH domain-containing protein [Actinomadura sp. WMMB 499]